MRGAERGGAGDTSLAPPRPLLSGECLSGLPEPWLRGNSWMTPSETQPDPAADQPSAFGRGFGRTSRICLTSLLSFSFPKCFLTTITSLLNKLEIRSSTKEVPMQRRAFFHGMLSTAPPGTCAPGTPGPGHLCRGPQQWGAPREGRPQAPQPPALPPPAVSRERRRHPPR